MSRHSLAGVLALCAARCSFPKRGPQAQQTFNVSLGYFTVRGRGRARRRRRAQRQPQLSRPSTINDFNGASIGGEWLIPVGRYIEAGAGVAFTRRTVPTVYTRFVNAERLGNRAGSPAADGAGSVHVPCAAARSGQRLPAVSRWRSGCHHLALQRIRPVRRHARPEHLQQLVRRIGHRRPGRSRWAGFASPAIALASGFEIRYQAAEADLPPPFAGTKIDLGGWSYLFTVGVRFGR